MRILRRKISLDRLGAVLFLLLCAFLCSSCSERQRVLLVVDRFWWQYVSGGRDFAADLSERLGSRGYNLSIEEVDPDSSPEIAEKRIRRARLVALSPLLAPYGPRLASAYPERAFLILDAEVKDGIPANLAVIDFDRREACERAGAMLGKVFAESSGSEKFGIFLLQISNRSRGEVDAFRKGFLQTASENRLVERVILDPKDRAKAKKMLEAMGREGAVLFLLKGYSLNDYCLEVVQRLGGSAIVDDWTASGSYGETVLMSFEPAYISSFEDALEKLGETGSSWPEPRIEGMVDTVYNKDLDEALKKRR
jgi:hypothetical protein